MKKVNQRNRALSFLLVLTLLFGTMTLFSFASEEEVTVLYEEESKRTEHEKHYFCSDGSYIAVSYPQAVHYLDDGVYRDIDNSLCYDEERAAYENAGNPAFGVSLSSENGLETVKVKGKDKEEITFSTALLVNGNGKTAQPKKKNINAFNRTAKSAQGKRVKGSDTFDLPLVSSSLEYDKYYGQEAQTVTGRYTLNGNSLKEDIVLSAPAGVTGFLTTYKAGGLTLTKNEDGSLTFSDEKGTALYTVGAPYMYDADGSACPAISVTVQKKGNKYEVSYLPDALWLNSSERVYPLTFDPTLEASVSDMMNCLHYEYNIGEDQATAYMGDMKVGTVYVNRTAYIYFQPSADIYPTVDLTDYTVTAVSLRLKSKFSIGNPYINVYQIIDNENVSSVPASCAMNAEKAFVSGVNFAYQDTVDFRLSTDYYIHQSLPRYVLMAEPTEETLSYCSFATYTGSNSSDNPELVVQYRPKAWGTDPTGAAQPMKFVLKNGTNYLLSNGGTVTARVPQAKETIDAEDFYYCEWVFNYNSTYYAHTISPAYDEELCLKANSDGTVSLVAIADGLTEAHYWTWGADMSSDKLWIKNAQYGSRLYTTECTETTTGALRHDASNTISATQKEWSATRTYQGVYTFRNVGTGGYMEVKFGYNYDNQNIQLQNEYDGDFGRNAFKMSYLPEYDAYRIMPIASSNGNFRGIATGTRAGENVYLHKNASSIFYVEVQDSMVMKVFTDENKTLALSASNGNVVLSLASGDSNQEWFAENYQCVLPDKTSDGEDVLVDYAQIEKYYSSLIFANPFRNNLQMILTSDFGQRCLDKDSSNDTKVGDVHEGIDLRASIGKELRSPCNGTVVYVGADPNSTGGKYVIIKTNYLGYALPNQPTAYSIYITYMHMDTINVSVGASVGVNTLIGTSGDSGKTSSGASYAAHLHYGVFLGSTLHTNGYVNPNTYPLDPWMFYPDILDKEEVDI